MSKTLKKLGDYQGAREGYQKSLEIERAYYGENHPLYATTL